MLLRRWAAEDDRLRGFETLSEVIAFVRRNPSARAANGVLAALLRISADDSSARRCALEALMPGLVRLAGHYPAAGEDPDDRLQNVLMLAVERIHELAGQDLEWPSHAVIDSVRDRLRRIVRRSALARTVPLEAALGVAAPPARSAAERLTGLLLSGLRQGSIRRDDAAVIYTTRVAGHPAATVAATMGVDPVVLRTRRRRAEQRLAGASRSVC
ncbi:MAG TPA: hypothetical protein VHF26_18950 [Trebonia sp.]|nr:hypothetical protein [Trebonia sp.]